MLRFTENLIAQMTLRCNKNCKYCYEHDEQGLAVGPLKDMSFEDFKKILDTYIYYRCVLGKKENVINWHFHGGEVFLLDWPLLKQMIDYLEERKCFFPGLDWCFQTNGTLVTEDIAKYFKFREKVIGFSLDSLHDDFRGTSEENQSIVDNLRLLHKSTGADFAYISVLSKDNKDTWIEDWNKLKDFCIAVGLNHICSKDDKYALSPEEIWSCWYKPVLESYLTDSPIPERNVKIMLGYCVSNMLFQYSKKCKTGCFSRECANGSNMINATSDGMLSPCDKYLETGDFAHTKHKVHIDKLDFLGLQNIKYLYNFYKKLYKEEKSLNCETCVATDFCMGECQSYMMSRYGTPKLFKENCLPYINMYNFVKEHLEDILIKNNIFFIESLNNCTGLTPFGREFLGNLKDKGLHLTINQGNIRLVKDTNLKEEICFKC